MTSPFSKLIVLAVGMALLAPLSIGCKPSKRSIHNVSYDPTRQLYDQYEPMFKKHWKEKTGEDIDTYHTNGGSGSQARKVVGGTPADVVTLALSYDIDLIVKEGKLIKDDWQSRLTNNSCPYTSTIVFLVRQGNPKQIKDWDDLTRNDIDIVTPDPKTSGGARWNYLAAWGYALKKELGDLSLLHDSAKTEEVKAANLKAREFVKQIFKNVKSMDSGARESSIRFAKMKAGDVLLAWENEALLYQRDQPEDRFEIVVPSVSILAEPPVAVVDKNVDQHKTRDIAEEYLKYLYTPEVQRIIANNYYRPSDPNVMKEFAERFPKVEMFSIQDVFGSWGDVQKEHFNSDAVFDQMLDENVHGK